MRSMLIGFFAVFALVIGALVVNEVFSRREPDQTAEQTEATGTPAEDVAGVAPTPPENALQEEKHGNGDQNGSEQVGAYFTKKRVGAPPKPRQLSTAQMAEKRLDIQQRGDASEVAQVLASASRAYAENDCKGTELEALAQAYRAGANEYTFKGKSRNWSQQIASDGIEWVLAVMVDAGVSLPKIHAYLEGFSSPACVPVADQLPAALARLQDGNKKAAAGGDGDGLGPSDRSYEALQSLTVDDAKDALVLPRFAVRRDDRLVFRSLKQVQPECAAILATHKHSLEFPAFDTLSPESAAALASHTGGFSRTGAKTDDALIVSIPALDPVVAKELAKKSGELQIGTKDRPVSEIGADAARELAEFAGRQLALCVSELSHDSQDAIAKCAAPVLFAKGPAVLNSVALARKIAGDSEAVRLSCGQMSPEAASALLEAAQGRDITLTDTFRCDESVARILASYPGQVTFIRLEPITPAVVDLLEKPSAVASPSGQMAGEPFENPIGMKFVKIEAGDFEMGVQQVDYQRSMPAHRVKLSKPFLMSQTEVTQSQFERVMGISPWKEQDSSGGFLTPIEGRDVAASNVSWHQAVQFCEKLSERERSEANRGMGSAYRLPTEAEWEYACRAGTKTKWHFGDDKSKMEDYAWWGAMTKERMSGAWKEMWAHEVAKKLPNKWGLYDMYGNVDEWCSDWFSEAHPGDGPAADPQGPQSGTKRVSRGGSFMGVPMTIDSATREGWAPGERRVNRGFRVVRELE